jgi:hypothetical protein
MFLPTKTKPVMLRLDPRWDPLRKDAQFQALLEKYPVELRPY